MPEPEPQRFDRSSIVFALFLALGLVLYHCILSLLSGYGYFIDEFYYIACANHLAFGYIDHPPLSILLLALNRWLLGDSLPALRLLPSLALGATVFVTGLLTMRLGGRGWTVVMACLAVIAMPAFLVMGSFYSMNAFEILIVTGILYLFVRMLKDDRSVGWVPIGILFGLGMEMKHTIALYGIALVLGMLVTPSRRLLRNRWFVIGVACSVLLLLPNLIWQAQNGFPSLEFYRNAMVNKNIPRGPLGILVDQFLFTNPLVAPLWIAGILYFLRAKRGEPYRCIGWAFAFLLLVMMAGRSSRPDRIAAIYPILVAAGAVAVQGLRREHLRRGLTGAVVVLEGTGLLIAAPLFTPLLSPPTTSAFISSLGISLSIESGKTRDPLPQWLGDRLGWEALALETSRVFHSLPDSEQRNAVIISTNYGTAGALDLLGKSLGLPRVYATHNSYHSWGPPPDSIRTYIAVAVPRRDLERLFNSVEEEGVSTCGYCTRPQQSVHMYIARGPLFSASAEWPHFKIYD